MAITNSTLNAIQKVGAAAFKADEALKRATRDYTDRFARSLVANPFNVGNDGLYEDCKVVARMSQTMASIEVELKKIYEMANELLRNDQAPPSSLLALPGPDSKSAGRVRRQNLTKTAADDVVEATMVVAPKPGKKRRAKRKATRSARPGNSHAERLLAHLGSILSAEEPRPIRQSALAKECGIPLGSMTSLLKKLTEHGKIQQVDSGEYKLPAISGVAS